VLLIRPTLDLGLLQFVQYSIVIIMVLNFLIIFYLSPIMDYVMQMYTTNSLYCCFTYKWLYYIVLIEGKSTCSIRTNLNGIC